MLLVLLNNGSKALHHVIMMGFIDLYTACKHARGDMCESSWGHVTCRWGVDGHIARVLEHMEHHADDVGLECLVRHGMRQTSLTLEDAVCLQGLQGPCVRLR